MQNSLDGIKSLIKKVLMLKYKKKLYIMQQFGLLSKLISNIVYVNNLLSISLLCKYTKIKQFKSQTKEYKEFGMGREEGRGCRMGNTGIPVADSFRYLAKLIQYCNV